MVLQLEDLEKEDIRDLMLKEFEKDILENKTYLSPRLKEGFSSKYIELVKEAIKNGNDNTLALSIISNNCLNSSETQRRQGKVIILKMYQ